ncbi:abortive infection protein [Comamonas endophytica]|uniref:Abortive infection protein n=1 Tax=Comamonas endophytica TaxID=2949090 RepID=A0ABY6G5J5_9BURK|nr:MULTISPECIES: abortive infection protein [unclassified Acidovorax]MCD2512266.1 abortive infection protein [Acidovorax sp. D4N7]UYG50277.1 abortive infection protein [Acidovorax sp. 5MLIR]
MSDAPATPSAPPRLQWRIFTVLWLLGMPGVSVLVWSIIPQWRHLHGLAPQWDHPPVLQMVMVSAWLALAVGIGVLLAPRVGLAAPILTTWVAGRSPREALRRMWLPGIAGGVAGAACLVTLAILWPDSLKVAEPLYTMPLLSKLLYGSLTSELLLRWGMLACVFWGLWRLVGRDAPLSAKTGWMAVMLSALLWALLHWMLARWLLGPLPGMLLLHVLLGKLAYGFLAGFLSWRFGLEAAILAHMVTYLLSHELIGPVL